MATKIKRDINNPIELEVLKKNAELGNVPNVTTNNQTPTWSMSNSLTNIISGETLTIIMSKISKAINDIISHIGNKSNPHNVTKSQIGLSNVENKNGATIRSELTKNEVTNALGYTPPTVDTKYSVANSSTLGLIKSGNDISVDSNGNVNVIGGDVNTAQTLKNARTINGISFNGSSDITIKANPQENLLTNQDLDDIKTSGDYYAGGSNTTINKPSGIDAFSLQVVRSASGYYTQILIGGNNNSNKMFVRTYQAGTWTSWISFYSSQYPQTSISGNAGTATKLQTARKIAGVSFDGTSDISISYNNLTNKPTIPSGVQVIDNLISSSSTASLSANQGRILKEYLDKKTIVSNTQPSGQQVGDVWYEII